MRQRGAAWECREQAQVLARGSRDVRFGRLAATPPRHSCPKSGDSGTATQARSVPSARCDTALSARPESSPKRSSAPALAALKCAPTDLGKRAARPRPGDRGDDLPIELVDVEPDCLATALRSRSPEAGRGRENPCSATRSSPPQAAPRQRRQRLVEELRDTMDAARCSLGRRPDHRSGRAAHQRCVAVAPRSARL
jgi:hypothetical protein